MNPNSEYADFPLITHIRTSTPRARHDYNCTICGALIPMGSKYKRYVYSDDEAIDQRRRIRTATLCLGGCNV